MIRISNLQHRFSAEVTIAYPDWQLTQGEHGLILGSSGSGKTTLLHLMSGILRPTSGAVFYDDQNISSFSSSQMDAFRGEHIGLVFQQPHLINALSVRKNIELATFFGHQSKRNNQVDNLLGSLGLNQVADRQIHEISQGQAQRVAIARALINEPKVVFGDEPTASLDDKSCESVVELLLEQSQLLGAMLIIATHDHRVKSYFSNKLVL